MHEFSLAQQILRTCLASAARYRAKRITRVSLQVGEFTLVVPLTLRECFRIASAGTIAEGAELAIERVPGEVKCNDCGHVGLADYEDDLPHVGLKLFSCKRCHSSNTTIVAGRELKVKNMSIEDPSG